MDIGKISAWLQVISTVAGITFFGLWPNSNLRNLAQEVAKPIATSSLSQQLDNFESELNLQLGEASHWKTSIIQQKAQIIHAQTARADPLLRTRLTTRANELDSDIYKLESYCQLAQSTLNELPRHRTEINFAPDRVADWIGLKQLALERHMLAIPSR